MNKKTEFGVSAIDFEETKRKYAHSKSPLARDERRHEALLLLLARELASVEDCELIDVQFLAETIHQIAGFEVFSKVCIRESLEETMKLMGWSFHRIDQSNFASRWSSDTFGPLGVDLRCCDQQVTILIDNGDAYPRFGEDYWYPALPRRLKKVHRAKEAQKFVSDLLALYFIEFQF